MLCELTADEVMKMIVNNELAHFGVRGMKWGVHKKYYKSYMDNDRVLKKDFKLQNISSKEKRDLSRNTPVYGAHTEHDKNAYAGHYANNITWFGDKAYINNLVLKKNVKIPSQKKSVELFMGLYNSDPMGMSKSIGKAYAELDYFHSIAKIKDYNANRISKKFTNKGEEWVKNKGYLMFNQSMIATEESHARVKYYDLLLKKGYEAINDVNDVQTGYNSDDPIIFINPKKTLKMVESRELSLKEIEIANARYGYDEALKLKGINGTVLNEQYREAKKEIKRVKKKYDLEE